MKLVSYRKAKKKTKFKTKILLSLVTIFGLILGMYIFSKAFPTNPVIPELTIVDGNLKFAKYIQYKDLDKYLGKTLPSKNELKEIALNNDNLTKKEKIFALSYISNLFKENPSGDYRMFAYNLERLDINEAKEIIINEEKFDGKTSIDKYLINIFEKAKRDTYFHEFSHLENAVTIQKGNMLYRHWFHILSKDTSVLNEGYATNKALKYSNEKDIYADYPSGYNFYKRIEAIIGTKELARICKEENYIGLKEKLELESGLPKESKMVVKACDYYNNYKLQRDEIKGIDEYQEAEIRMFLSKCKKSLENDGGNEFNYFVARSKYLKYANFDREFIKAFLEIEPQYIVSGKYDTSVERIAFRYSDKTNVGFNLDELYLCLTKSDEEGLKVYLTDEEGEIDFSANSIIPHNIEIISIVPFIDYIKYFAPKDIDKLNEGSLLYLKNPQKKFSLNTTIEFLIKNNSNNRSRVKPEFR